MLLCVHKIILIRPLWLENVYGDHFFLDTVYKTVITSSWLDKLTLLPANHWLVPRNLLTCLSLSAACLISSGFSDCYIKTLCVNKQLRQYDLQFTVWKSLLVMGKNWYSTKTVDIIFRTNHHHHHHQLRLAPLRVRSTTGHQQPPEWSVLGQVDCLGPWQPIRVEVILHRLHPCHPGGLFQYTEGEEVKICLALYCRPFGRYAWIDAVPG